MVGQVERSAMATVGDVENHHGGFTLEEAVSWFALSGGEMHVGAVEYGSIDS